MDDLNLLSPESFHIFFELSDSAVAVLNRAGLVNYCNSKSLQLWKDPNLQGKTILEFLSTENAQTLLRIIYSVLGTRQSVSDEISAVVQGRALILHFSIHALSGAAELSEQVVFSATDITKNKQRDQALQQFRLIADNTHDIVLLVDQVSGQILDANMAALSAYGYTYEEVLGLKILDLRKDSPELVRLQMAEASHKGLLFEAVHYRKNGSSFPVEVSTQSAMINGKATLISIIRDISERRNLHRQLIESEEKFAKAFDTNPLPMAITDLECSVYLDVNMAFVNRLGYSFGEAVCHRHNSRRIQSST